MSISAVIAENYDLTRQGVRSLLENQLDARVAATTRDGLEVFDLIVEHDPDLLILDLGLPHLNGLDVLRKIQEQDLQVAVVVLSMHPEEARAVEAFELGASAYVLKGAPLEELIEGIRAALVGTRYLDSGLSDSILAAAESPSETNDRYERLTDREREVLQLTAEGHTSEEIGERLHISPRTVEKHRENIKSKLELRNVVEMANYAHRRGLIPNASGFSDD